MSKLSDESLAARVFGLALLVALAEYAALLFAGFVWDDFAIVVCNALTGSLTNLPRFFSIDLWMSSGSAAAASGYFRPLMLLSLAVDHALWGNSPAGHHLHSVLWHLLAGTALFALLRRLTPALPAAIGAAVFLLHPVQSEAIAWISARNDLMVAAFLFAALAQLVAPRPGAAALVCGSVCALGALLSKESGVMVLPALLLLDVARFGRPVGPTRYLGVTLAGLAWLALRAGAGITAASVPDATQLDALWERLPMVLALYAGRVAAPLQLTVGLTLEYLDRLPRHLQVGAGLAALGALVAARRGRGLALAGLLFAVATLAPSILALAVRGQLGERYLYMPMGGVALVVAAAWPAQRRALWALAPLALGATWLVHARLPDWRDDITLWRSAVAVAPSGYTWTSLAHALNGDTGRSDAVGEGCRPSAFKAPEELAQRDRFEAAMLYHRALRESQPPFLGACDYAVWVPSRIGSRALLQEGIALTEAAHCPVSMTLARSRTVAFIALGDEAGLQRELDRLDRKVEWTEERWLRLARAVRARQVGDEVAYARLRDSVPEAPESFDRDVARLMRDGALE